jgi:hypothetical protein
MPVVRSLHGLFLRVQGEPHSGWLPRGASPPPDTDTKDVQLDVEIHELDPPESGFLLISSSSDPEFNGDSWHLTLEQALQQAEHQFGILPSEWRAAAS